ncbi:hypothetical protein [uncultured Desulfosarcina sp.]|uniref:hypothetical protein n=1 Tax=uncultured Desulfosarcina sp. TaxID=218289 RepID=UPI0029C872D1|nr:hypothetical protein [uncultured Desulfosarcina sp.]
MSENPVEYFLKELAEYYAIGDEHGYKTELFDAVSGIFGIKDPNRLSQWIFRKRIPKPALSKILRSDLPDKIKKLAEKCDGSAPFPIGQETANGIDIQIKESQKNPGNQSVLISGIDDEKMELLRKVSDIINSESPYAELLKANIRSFHNAMEQAQTIQKNDEWLKAMQAEIDALKSGHPERRKEDIPIDFPDRREGGDRRNLNL